MASIAREARLYAVPDPPAWYVRIGHNDHLLVENYLSVGGRAITRAVVDAVRVERQHSLIEALRPRGVELILDTRGAELASPIAATSSAARLPWAQGSRASSPIAYTLQVRREIAKEIANFVLTHRFSGVLAPTHFIRSDSDEWLALDLEMVAELRDTLDQEGGRNVSIHYPLVIPYSTVRDRHEMENFAAHLGDAPIDVLWMQVANFGNDKSPGAVNSYIEGAWRLLASRKPVVADHVGGQTALALFAFGAAGGISHGIGVHERFTVNHWFRPKSSGGRQGQPKRVYCANIDMYLKATDAYEMFNDRRLRARLACRDTRCCPRGADDMLTAEKTHFLNSRFSQLTKVGQFPDEARASRYISQVLAPTAAEVIRFGNALDSERYPELASKAQRKRLFLDGMRGALENLAENNRVVPRSSIPARVVAACVADNRRPAQ